MEYERIDKPAAHQAAGFSPRKLRAMLLGVEKHRKEEEDLDSRFSLRSHNPDVDDTSGGGSDGCKDAECSTSTDGSGQRTWDHKSAAPRVRIQEEDSADSDSVASLVAFEFHKSERAVHHRPALVPPFSKPTPSKWDDAEKWIASPTANRQGKGGGAMSKKSGLVGYGGRNPAPKVVVEVEDEADGKRNEASLAKKEISGQKAVSWVPELYPVVNLGAKPAVIVSSPVHDSAVSLSQHDSSQSFQTATTLISPTVKSLSMRDTGTEMTPVTSQEPSRTGTPVKATTPTRSPISSGHSTPGKRAQSSNLIESDYYQGGSSKEFSGKELQMEVRREIMVLGTKLGKTNITTWARKEQEDIDVFSHKTAPLDETAESVNDSRAAAWEEAEKAKYLSRFKRDEIKIQAWENHQKAKTEAEMRKTEVEVEKMRARAQDRLMSKQAAARHKAEEKRAAAESRRNQQAARTAQQAEYIRRTGQIPSSFFFCGWCS